METPLYPERVGVPKVQTASLIPSGEWKQEADLLGFLAAADQTASLIPSGEWKLL